jgi:hypothetical protein
MRPYLSPGFSLLGLQPNSYERVLWFLRTAAPQWTTARVRSIGLPQLGLPSRDLFSFSLSLSQGIFVQGFYRLAFCGNLGLRDKDLLSCSAGFLWRHACFLNSGEARYLGLTISPNSDCPQVHELDPNDKDIGSITQQGAMSFLESTTHVIKILYVFFIKS